MNSTGSSKLVVLLAVVVTTAAGVWWWRGDGTADWPRALRHVPSDWATVQIDGAEVERFLERLPRVKQWLDRADELDRRFPATAEDRQLENLFAGTRGTVHAVAPGTVAFGLYTVGQFMRGFQVPGDLNALIQAATVQEVILRQPIEYGTLSVKAGRYRAGGAARWQLGGQWYTEPEAGVLISSGFEAGLERLTGTTTGKHPALPAGAALLAQVGPEFFAAPVWQEIAPTWKSPIRSARLVARLAKDSIVLEAEVECVEAPPPLAKALPEQELPPWLRSLESSVKGTTLHVRAEIADSAIDQLLPTPDDALRWVDFMETLGRRFRP